jgi:hypothetical protein
MSSLKSRFIWMQELLHGQVEFLIRSKAFFAQRRKIIRNAAVLLQERADVHWLTPRKFFLHGAAIIGVALVLSSLAFHQFVNFFYDRSIDTMYRVAKEEERKMPILTGGDHDAAFKKRDENLKWAINLERQQMAASRYTSTYGTLRSIVWPLSVFVSSFLFQFLFRKKQVGTRGKVRADSLYLYLTMSHGLWPLLMVSIADLVFEYNKAYFETGPGQWAFFGADIQVGWFAIGLLYIAAAWTMFFALPRMASALGNILGASTVAVFFAIWLISLCTNIVFASLMTIGVNLFS